MIHFNRNIYYGKQQEDAKGIDRCYYYLYLEYQVRNGTLRITCRGFFNEEYRSNGTERDCGISKPPKKNERTNNNIFSTQGVRVLSTRDP